MTASVSTEAERSGAHVAPAHVAHAHPSREAHPAHPAHPSHPLHDQHLSRGADDQHLSQGADGPTEAIVPSPARPDAERAVADLLRALGREPVGELAHTPRRVADTLADLLTPRPFTATTFPNDTGSADLVELNELPFASLCEHHLLPFHGTVRVAYVPGDLIAGFSTFAHAVDHVSRGLQLQERLTGQLADWIERTLRPRGLVVTVEATQLCMWMRGAGTHGTRTTTSAARGELRRPGPVLSHTRE